MVKKYFLLLAAIFSVAITSTAQITVEDSIVVDGRYRSYRLYIPTALSSGNHPLVLNMHGLGSNAIEQQYYGNFMPIADTAGFYVVMPQGLSATYMGTTTTFWSVGFPGTPSNVDDVKFLSALIDTLAARYPVDMARVYATGMSNGGYMAHILGLQLNNKIAAIASVAGSIVPGVYATLTPVRSVPAMQIHGTADSTVPYNGFAFFGMPLDTVVQFWIRNNGCNATPVQTSLLNINTTDNSTADHFVWSGGRNGATVEFFRINGGSHSWPGAFPVFPSTNQDFSASSEIWRFFRQYRLGQLNNPPAAVGSSPTTISTISIVPNPAHDRLYVQTATAGTATIRDVTGKVMLRATQKDIDVAALPAGIFMLQYSGSDGSVSFTKFVKE